MVNVPESFFATRDGHLADALRQLESRLCVDRDKFVHATQSRLSLARDQVSANTKDINLVLLLIERVDCCLADIAASTNFDFSKLGLVVLLCNRSEDFTSLA